MTCLKCRRIKTLIVLAAQLCEDLTVGRDVKLSFGLYFYDESYARSGMSGSNIVKRVKAIMVDFGEERQLEYIHIFLESLYAGKCEIIDPVPKFSLNMLLLI